MQNDDLNEENDSDGSFDDLNMDLYIFEEFADGSELVETTSTPTQPNSNLRRFAIISVLLHTWAIGIASIETMIFVIVYSLLELIILPVGFWYNKFKISTMTDFISFITSVLKTEKQTFGTSF